MPWCPNCLEEYRDGVKTCYECGEILVDERPTPQEPEALDKDKEFVFYDDSPLPDEILLIESNDEVEFGFYCNALDDYDVPFRSTLQNGNSYIEIYTGKSMNKKNIYVAADDYDRALLACQNSAAHLPLPIPPEDELTDEDVSDPFSTMMEYIHSNITWILLAGFAFVIFIIFAILFL